MWLEFGLSNKEPAIQIYAKISGLGIDYSSDI
jgi:hypothetical protein